MELRGSRSVKDEYTVQYPIYGQEDPTRNPGNTKKSWDFTVSWKVSIKVSDNLIDRRKKKKSPFQSPTRI